MEAGNCSAQQNKVTKKVTKGLYQLRNWEPGLPASPALLLPPSSSLPQATSSLAVSLTLSLPGV